MGRDEVSTFTVIWPKDDHSITKMSKVKDKERISKAAREKQLVTYGGVPIRP